MTWWSYGDIVDALHLAMRRRAEELDEEQAVFGLDAMTELELHPVLAEGLEAAGYGAHREIRYPGRREAERLSEGERCDLVLTPDGRPLASEAKRRTLFDPADAVPLDDAFWLEVKSVAQHLPEGPNANYSGQLLEPIRRDVRKLAKDEKILHAGVLIILFTAESRVADNDLRIWQERCLDQGLSISAAYRRELHLADRHGNAWCSLSLAPVHHL
jgi:hypothetical protein